MNLRRTFRGPILWVIVAILVVFALLEIATAGGSYKNVSLPTIQQQITNHNVESATIKDTSQLVQITTKTAVTVNGSNEGTKLQSSYSLHYDDTLYNELRDG